MGTRRNCCLIRSARSRLISQLRSSTFFITAAVSFTWKRLRYTRASSRSGVTFTAVRDTSPPSIILRPSRWNISLSSCISSAPTCFCLLPSCIAFKTFSPNWLYLVKTGAGYNITAKFASKFTAYFSMKKFSVILQYLARYKGKIVLYMFFNILSIIFGLISLGMLSSFLDILFKEGAPVSQQTTLNTNAIGGLKHILVDVVQTHDKSTVLIIICLFIIVSTFLKNLFYYWSSYISSPIRSATITFLRNDVYEKILALPIGYFTERRKGDLISRMTNDIYEIESSVVSTLEGLIKDPLTIIGYLAYMIYLSPHLSLFLLVLLPVTGFLIGRISRTLKRQSKDASIKLGESLSVLDETLGGIRVIKGFGAESLLRNKFIQLNDSLFHIRNKMNARRDLASPLTETLGIVILTIILYYGGTLIFRTHGKGFSGGDLMTYIAVFGLLINPAKNLSTSIFNIQRGAAAIERVEDLLKAPVTIQDNPVAKKLEAFSDRIEFRGVSFSYEDAG